MKKLAVMIATLLLFPTMLLAARHSQNDNWGIGVTNPQSERVEGYERKDGTYVAPYERTKANDTLNDNYSTKGNENPWTGQKGYGKTDEEKTESDKWYRSR